MTNDSAGAAPVTLRMDADRQITKVLHCLRRDTWLRVSSGLSIRLAVGSKARRAYKAARCSISFDDVRAVQAVFHKLL